MTYGTVEVESVIDFYVNCVGSVFSMMQTTVLFEWNGIQITLLYIAVMFLVAELLLLYVQYIRGY